MHWILRWIWQAGVVGSFLTGLFAILPIVITGILLAWVGRLLHQWVGPESFVGTMLKQVGLRVVSEPLAIFAGWIIVLVGIWLLGIFVQTIGRKRFSQMIERFFAQVPLIARFYNPVVQVLELFRRQESDQLASMPVVYCHFGAEYGGGFLGIQVSSQLYRFNGHPCYLVYVPTSPVPMSGGLVLVPQQKVYRLDMSVDALLQIYLSIGVMATRAIPKQYSAESPQIETTPSGSEPAH